MKKIKRREIIKAQKNEILELEETILQIRSRIKLIGWILVGLIVAAFGWIIISSLVKDYAYISLSDADRRYENFFDVSDGDGQHLFHFKEYLKANGVKFKYTQAMDKKNATSIYVCAEKDTHKIVIRSKTNWHKKFYNETWVPYERNIGEASIEVSTSEYIFLHGASWTLSYEWSLQDDEFIQDLDTGMFLPCKLLEDLDSVLANNKLADYKKNPFEDVADSNLKIRLNGEEVTYD